MSALELNINEDFLRRFTVEGVRASDGTFVDAPGLALQVRIALTQTGAAIGGLSTAAGEYVDDPGFYYAGFDKADLITELTPYIQRLVYVIVSKVGDLDCVFWEYRVVTSRQAL